MSREDATDHELTLKLQYIVFAAVRFSFTQDEERFTGVYLHE